MNKKSCLLLSLVLSIFSLPLFVTGINAAGTAQVRINVTDQGAAYSKFELSCSFRPSTTSYDEDGFIKGPISSNVSGNNGTALWTINIPEDPDYDSGLCSITNLYNNCKYPDQGYAQTVNGIVAGGSYTINISLQTDTQSDACKPAPAQEAAPVTTTPEPTEQEVVIFNTNEEEATEQEPEVSTNVQDELPEEENSSEVETDTPVSMPVSSPINRNAEIGSMAIVVIGIGSFVGFLGAYIYRNEIKNLIKARK